MTMLEMRLLRRQVGVPVEAVEVENECLEKSPPWNGSLGSVRLIFSFTLSFGFYFYSCHQLAR